MAQDTVNGQKTVKIELKRSSGKIVPTPQSDEFRASLQEAILNQAPDGILVVDQHDCIASVNRRFLEIWRIPVPESGLDSLIGKPDAPAIDLFYSTSAPDKGFIERIRQIADAARIRLHVLVADKDGRLNAERIRQQVPDWKRSDVWFCGPAGFGSALRRDFASSGLSADDFHQELFDMR